MWRYRIAKDPKGHYFVLPALGGIVPLEETYSSQPAARQMADWCNTLSQRARWTARASPDDTVSVPIRGRQP